MVIIVSILIGTYAFTVWGPSLLHPAKPTIPPVVTASVESSQQTPPVEVIPPVVKAPVFEYIEIVSGCNWEYVGTCMNMRAGPGTQFPVVLKLRTGIVLKVSTTTQIDGKDWYKIQFDEGLRFPERVTQDWYVAADPESVKLFEDGGDSVLTPGATITTNKRIEVNLTTEMLYAYDGDTLFMQDPISTGLELTPTPTGTFSVYKKTPSRYMQGPIVGVSDQYYDLPGVPWDLYFTKNGAVIHGAYWHNQFGHPWSHGCVNLSPLEAERLYMWADIGTPVLIKR